MGESKLDVYLGTSGFSLSGIGQNNMVKTPSRVNIKVNIGVLELAGLKKRSKKGQQWRAICHRVLAKHRGAKTNIAATVCFTM